MDHCQDADDEIHQNRCQDHLRGSHPDMQELDGICRAVDESLQLDTRHGRRAFGCLQSLRRGETLTLW